MEKITNKRIKEDLEKIAEMLADYNSDIWCRQEGDPNDYDHQSKLVRLAMADVRTGLFIAREALYKLTALEVKE